MSKGVQIAIATLSIFGALGWMMASGEGSFQYFAQISQLSDSDRGRDTGLRIHGFVADGSILRDVAAGQVDFAIHDGATEPNAEFQAVRNEPSLLRIRYDGIYVPDLFRDGAEVVVEGGFRDGTFVATRIMAKCPSKYEVEPAVPAQKA